MMLGSTELTRSYETCQLGINIIYFKDDEECNLYGYKLKWSSKKTDFSRMAYRMQDIRNLWDPHMRWRCCDSYVIGKLQYASGLHWLRADKFQKQNVRFNYSMAMAAILGMTAPEVVSMRCCKIQRVSDGNAGYLKACEFLNMPTLRDMAILSARRLLGQWKRYRPELFLLNESEDEEIISIIDTEGLLLKDLFELSTQDVNDWYPVFNAYKGPGKWAKVQDTDKPLWLQYWLKAKAQTKNGDSFNDKLANTTYMCMCRDYFDVLEPIRRVRRQIAVPLCISQKRAADPRRGNAAGEVDNQSGSKKRKLDNSTAEVSIRANLECSVPPPKVRGSKKRPCRT